MINYNNPTDNEIRRIVAEALEPEQQVVILSELTGRSEADIRSICGMKPPKMTCTTRKKGRPSVWDDEKKQYLYDHPDESCHEIAKKFGVSYSSVTSMRYNLGIIQTSIWTEDLIEKLILAYQNGLRALQISKLLDVDHYEVQKKITSLKMSKKLG